MAVAEHLQKTATAGADVQAIVGGKRLQASRDLGFGAKEYTLDLATLRGKSASLRLEAATDEPVAFVLDAKWRRPLDAAEAPVGTSAEVGPDVYRVFTDASGGAVDLSNVKAGEMLRVAVLARLPIDQLDRNRRGYVAITDRLPAGFEPVQPDLATVAAPPGLTDQHPFSGALRYGGEASHIELRDDRVDVYFDRTWGEFVAASYLVRATTPGRFVVPPAAAELMYEAGSHGYSQAATVVVQ